ncbi:MAG: zinc ABC transporter substrate-binding protein [Polyangiaceae bacterium]|nr:zinc ABC transporter substrate-binding protein [Polyangiaceae bacterium]
MRPHRLLALLVTLAVAIFGKEAMAAVTVVTTTPDLAAIARHVGGGVVEVKSLALPTQDPHFVDARPNLALLLNRADLLLVQGLELEAGWLPVLQAGARNPKIQAGADGFLDCSTLVQVLEVPDASVTRAQGDVHRGGNPHYLMDPRNGGKVAKGIAARLGKIDPANAAAYEQRAAELERAAAALASKVSAAFAALDAAKRRVVVYHRSWIYFEQWLGLSEAGAIEPKPGIPPDPGHVAQLMVSMRSQGVRAILTEEFYPQTTSKLLADKTGAGLVVIAGGAGDAQGYLERIQQAADRTLAALSR